LSRCYVIQTGESNLCRVERRSDLGKLHPEGKPRENVNVLVDRDLVTGFSLGP